MTSFIKLIFHTKWHAVLPLVACLTIIMLASAEGSDNQSFHPSLVSESLRHRSIIQLTGYHTELNVAPYLWLYKDTTGNVEFENIFSHHVAVPWQKYEGSSPNLGLAPSPYWFRLHLNNASEETIVRRLEIHYPLLDNIQLYHVIGDELISRFQTGDSFRFNQRPVLHRNFIFPLEFPPHTESQVFIRVKTDGAMQLPIRLWHPDRNSQKDQLAFSGQIVFIGIVLAMACYNFLLFVSLKDLSFLFYVVHIISTGMVQLILHGTPFQFLWSNSPDWNQISLPFFVGLSITSAAAFVFLFLKLYRYPRLISATAIATALIGLTVAFFSVTSEYTVSATLASSASGVGSVLLLTIGIYLCLQGNDRAFFFTGGWSVYLLSILVLSCSKIGILPSTALIEYSPQIGVVLEAFIFAFALAKRIHEEKSVRVILEKRNSSLEKEIHRLEQENREIQRRANNELEHRVKLRMELTQADSDSPSAHEVLTENEKFDNLTSLYHGDFFEHQLRNEWSRCSRSISSLSLMLLDIDGFGRINHQFGQLYGDHFLQETSKLLSRVAMRAGDRIYRLDDDTFAILLPHCATEGALQVAEQIRSQVEANLVVTEDVRTSATVSVGVATDIPDQTQGFARLYERATDALREAQTQGGNTVQFSL